jgi:hypothetical protein
MRILGVIHTIANRFGDSHALVDKRLPTYLCREKQPATDGNGEQYSDPSR